MARNGVRWVAAALAVTAILGFTPLGCAGGRLGAAAGQGDAEMPEGVAREIRTCAAKHLNHLGSARHTVSFDVKLASDGEVDSVALRESTLGDEGLEACMASALRSLCEGDLPMRHSYSHPGGPAAPESRALLGQVEALECIASPPCLLVVAFFVGAAYVAVQIYLHAAQSSTAKPKPRTAATTEPIATAVPTTIPVSRKDACTDMFVVCQEKAGRCTRITDWGLSLCGLCRDECQAEKAYTHNECYKCGFQ